MGAIEIVYIPSNEEDEQIQCKAPSSEKHDAWLTLGFDAVICETLKAHFKYNHTPSLIFVNQDADVLYSNGIISVTIDDPSQVAEKLMVKYHKNRITEHLRES